MVLRKRKNITIGNKMNLILVHFFLVRWSNYTVYSVLSMVAWLSCQLPCKLKETTRRVHLPSLFLWRMSI